MQLLQQGFKALRRLRNDTEMEAKQGAARALVKKWCR